MNKINKIYGVPGIGIDGEIGISGNNGYNMLYTSKKLNNLRGIINNNMSFSLNNKCTICKYYVINKININFDIDALIANITIDVNNISNINNIVEFVLVFNNINVIKKENKYSISGKEISGYFIKNDKQYDTILSITSELDSSNYIISELSIKMYENTHKFITEEKPIECTLDNLLLDIGTSRINTGDHIIDGDNNIYKVIINNDELTFELINNALNTNLFKQIDDTSIINIEHKILLQDSLFSIDEIYDNNIHNGKMIIASDNHFININSNDSSLNIKYDTSKSSFNMSTNNAILCNNLYVNANSNILNTINRYDIIDAIIFENSSINISNLLDDNILNNLMITDTSCNIIKKFNENKRKYYLSSNSTDTIIIYYKYNINNKLLLNTMFLNNNNNKIPKIIKCNADVPCNIKWSNFIINVDNVISGTKNIKMSVTFDSDISIGGKAKKEHIFNFNGIPNTGYDASIDINYNNSSDKLYFYIKTKEENINHTNRIHILEPNEGYLHWSKLENGVPSNCVLMVFDIYCEDLKDTSLDISINIGSTFHNKNVGSSDNVVVPCFKIVDDGECIDTSGMFCKKSIDSSVTSITKNNTYTNNCSEFVYNNTIGTHIMSNSESITLERGKHKKLLILYDIFKMRANGYITIDKIHTLISLVKDNVSLVIHLKNTILIPVCPIMFVKFGGYNYVKNDKNINNYEGAKIQYNYTDDVNIQYDHIDISVLGEQYGTFNRIAYNKVNEFIGTNAKNYYYRLKQMGDIYIEPKNYDANIYNKLDTIYKKMYLENITNIGDYTGFLRVEYKTQSLAAQPTVPYIMEYNSSGILTTIRNNIYDANIYDYITYISTDFLISREANIGTQTYSTKYILTYNYENSIEHMNETINKNISIKSLSYGFHKHFNEGVYHFQDEYNLFRQYEQLNTLPLDPSTSLYSLYHDFSKPRAATADDGTGVIYILDQPRFAHNTNTGVRNFQFIDYTIE